MSAPLLAVRDLVRHFDRHTRGMPGRARTGAVRAVDGISFELGAGETLGLVGESGCGKTTTARLLLGLLEATGGSVVFDGTEVGSASGAELRRLRREMQIVFQDPDASLNPRLPVREIVAEGPRIHGDTDDLIGRIGRLLEQVGLDGGFMERYPHELSGGQRQRVGIARALAVEPRLLVLDEPVSALDVSVQAQILNLLADLRDALDLTMVFIAHDLSVVRRICDRVAVMYLGRVVEIGDRDEIFDRPTHPYTQALLSAVPIPDPAVERTRRRIPPVGDPPSAADPPTGCRFHPRCPKAAEVCAVDDPELRPRVTPHASACHFAEVLPGDRVGAP